MTNEFEKLLEQYLTTKEEEGLQKGQIVKGTVVAEDDQNYYVDIGYKIEAILPKEEVESLGKKLNIGDEVEAVLVRITPRLQNPKISLKALKIKKAIEEIKEAQGKEKPFNAVVEKTVERNGKLLGYIIDINGIKAFIPAVETTRRLKEGETVRVFITNVKQQGKQLRITASQKKCEEWEITQLLKQYREKIKAGDIVDGRVVKINPEKGITVNVRRAYTGEGIVEIPSGIRGFITLDELSWGKNKNPFDYAEVGERIKAKVIDWSKGGNFLLLSLKRLKPNPWENIEEKYKVGEKYPARIVSMIDKGVFVELEEGVEAYVPKTELAWHIIPDHPKELFEKGQRVEVVITHLDKNNKRIRASIKKAQPKPWEKYYDEHPAGTVVKGKVLAIEKGRALVELAPGVLGFVKRNDLSWLPLKDKKIEDFLKPNEEREFMVLGLSRDQIRLGIKQLQPNPYEEIKEKYADKESVTLPVIGVIKGGYILEFPNGVEAFMPKREATRKLKPGEEVEVKILSVDPEKQKVVVSMREKEMVEERKTFEQFMAAQQKTESTAGFTLADILKAKLGKK